MSLSNLKSTDFNVDQARILHHILLLLFCFISLFAVGGNLLVCAAVYTDRQLRQKRNALYVSLAVADMLLASIVMVLAAIYEATGYWIFSQRLCDIFLSLDVMCCTASILSLVAIACDHYLHICKPLTYHTYMTKCTLAVIIVLLWCCSGILSFLPIHLNWHQLEKNVTNMQNDITDTGKPECMLKLNPVYALVSSTISFFLPCLLMCIVYMKLFLVARRHIHDIRKQTVLLIPQHSQLVIELPTEFTDSLPKRQSLRILMTATNHGNDPRSSALRMQKSEESLSPYNGSLTSDTSHKCGTSKKTPTFHKSPLTTSNNRRRISADHKAAVTLGVILGTFLTCWLPFFIINCIQAICGCIPDSVFKGLTWLGYFNSCLNPVLYSLVNLEFRSAFARILGCRRRIHNSHYNSEYEGGNSYGQSTQPWVSRLN